ncbi:MAG: LytR C-terminal domain-containing protein [Ilumatobacter sp.]
MSNEESALGASRRTPRQGAGASPVGSWLTIVLAVIAVVAGFLILRNITDDSSAASPGSSSDVVDSGLETDDTLVAIEIPDTVATTTTTTIVRTTTGSSVLVANANTVGGSAGNMTRTLELAGYEMIADPVNATGPNISASIVYFDSAQAAAEEVANSVARDLGGVEVLPVSTPAPTTSGDLGSAGVLVLLGDDQAGRTLEELSPTPATDVAEEGVAAPDPSDGDVPVTAPADADIGGDEATDEG